MAKKSWPTGIRPHGSGIQIRISKNGRYIYEETITGDAHNSRDLAAAIRRRDDLNARVQVGLPLHSEQPDEANAYQFAAAAQEYLNCLDASYSTHMEYERALNRYWLPIFGTWQLRDIQSRHIKGALSKLNIASKTKRNAIIPLRSVFNHFEINPNPAAAIKIKKQQKKPIRRFTPEEREQILSRLDGQNLVYFTLLFATGLRPSEAIALKWADYDGTSLEIYKAISRGQLKETKTYERRRVYVPEWARPTLNNHVTRFEGDWIFKNKAGRYHETKPMNEAWQKAIKTAELPYRIPYTCRHSRAAELLSRGDVEPGEAAKQLGHTLEMFYRTYSEFIEEYSKNRDDSRFEGVPMETTKKQK